MKKMLNKLIGSTSAIDETAHTTRKRTFISVLFTCLMVYFIASFATSFIQMLPIYNEMTRDAETMNLFSSPDATTEQLQEAMLTTIKSINAANPHCLSIVNLFSTSAIIFIVCFYCQCIERRRLFTMGFATKGAIKEYLGGILIGFTMFSAAYVIILLSGNAEFKGFNVNVSWETILLFFAAYIVQGASEEILLRGFFFVSLSANSSTLTALFSSSAFFAFIHLSNYGIGPIALINIFLFGAFAALYFLRRGTIWGICAIHTVWNFAQGCIYGCNVSGISSTASVFNTVLSGNALFSGGDFGPEGSIAVTIVLLIAIGILLPIKNNNIEAFFARRCKRFISYV